MSMNYAIQDTVHFAYNDKEVWGTIMGFGNGFVTMITNKGYRNYSWNKVVNPVLYRCSVLELVKLYEYHRDERFKYLYDLFGSAIRYSWKED
jgi:hypothetical protein